MANGACALQVPRHIPFASGEHLTEDEWQRLDQRRLWLTERIKAKKAVGWEKVYDESERDALASALPLLRQFVR